jgi:hypothetical protein
MKRALVTKEPSYAAEAEKTVTALPSTFAEIRVKKAAEKGDPSPLSLITLDEKTYLFLPKELPDDNKEKCLTTLGFLIKMAKDCNISIAETEKPLSKTFWKTIDLVSDSVYGAYVCTQREKLSPGVNIPAEMKLGYEYMLWYAYSKAANDQSGGQYLAIPRVTSLFASVGNPWGQDKQFSEITQLYSLLRFFAAIYSKKIDSPKKFLKGEGYFLERFVGKKPVGGLYTDEELPKAVQHWTDKVKKVKDVYHNIPDKFSSIGLSGISEILKRFNIETPKTIKDVEDAKSKRIPLLLVKSGKGKNQKTEIAKGGNLPEKLISIEGGDSVRTIGKVLWSPNMAISTNEFIDLVIKNTNSMLDKSVKSAYIDVILSELRDKGQAQKHDQIAASIGAINQATTVYLEVLPDKRGNSTWDAVFPQTKKN